MGEGQKTWQKALVLGSSISSSLAILVGGGYFLGKYLDDRLLTKPLFTISCMLIGLALGGYYLVITLQKFGASNDKN